MPTTATKPATTAEQAPTEEQPTAESVTGYQRTYPGRAEQVRQVRCDVARHLGDSPVAADAVLVASEIAANAILHSRSRGESFTIRLELHRDHCRVECQDSGGAWRRRWQGDRSHGLGIVEALTGADGWGIERVSGGDRVVWARLGW